MTSHPRENLQEQIAQLERRQADLQSRWPAHSIPAAMLAELDELDDRLAALRARLAATEP